MRVRRLGLLLLLAPLLMAQALAPSGPNPGLPPDAVVRILLDALRDNDRPAPDAGIALAFRFASPGNRAQTGPLARFSEMMRNGYPEMLNHREARLLQVLVQDAEAIQPVELVAKDGTAHRYLFILSRQTEPPCAGCWMTDSVLGDPDRIPDASQDTI